ncbi:hypothetical protein E2542_SST04366 [Spatholobus suberectus]|nr:hypothetical protein E2542_SST04366 [Spatholobus suberectus]
MIVKQELEKKKKEVEGEKEGKKEEEGEKEKKSGGEGEENKEKKEEANGEAKVEEETATASTKESNKVVPKVYVEWGQRTKAVTVSRL